MAVGLWHFRNSGKLTKFTLCGLYIDRDRWVAPEGTAVDDYLDEAKHGDGCRRCARSLARASSVSEGDG